MTTVAILPISDADLADRIIYMEDGYLVNHSGVAAV